MTDHHVRTTCRLCSSPSLVELLRLPDTPLANELPVRPSDHLRAEFFPLFLVGCEQCGHVQLPVVVDPKRLFPPTYPYASATSPVFAKHLHDLAKEITFMTGSRFPVLDIACNDGTLVKAFHAQSVSAYGIDPAAPNEPWCYRTFFTEDWAHWHVNNDGRQYAIVTALNCLAHIDDLDDIVRGVKVLLEPGGLFVVEVGYALDMIAKGRFSLLYHEHLSFHHLRPLDRFFRRHGMTLVDAERIDSQGGSIRMFVREGEHRQSDRLVALEDEEGKTDLFAGVRRLSESVDKAREQLAANAPLVLYGAPAKLCTLLHATGMTEAVQYVVDDNPAKVGKHVPGTAIPMLPVSTLYERSPARVMITAWNFAEDIMRKHAELGCEWVVSHG